MIEYIKKPYIPSIAGVTNTETGWKITRDVDGLDIIDEVPVSVDTVDRYVSNILLPIGTTVQIWYRMKLSNGEQKQYVGPFEYVSRESNITNDLKPITRVETPSVHVVNNSIGNGQPNVIFGSSIFRGDKLDGHFASSWIIKSPAGEIIDKSIASVANRNQFTMNRITKNLGIYSYIDVLLKHHSNNGATSEFKTTRFDLNIYPFTYSGPIFIDSLKPYEFTIVPTNPSKSNLDYVTIEDIATGNVVYTLNDVSELTFTVPAMTLDEGGVYLVCAYVKDRTGPSYTYYPRLETKISVTKQKDSMPYTREVEYDIMGMIATNYYNITHNVTGGYKIVDKKAIARVSNNLVKIYKDGPDFKTKDVTIDDAILPYLTDDFKVFNTRYDRTIIVSRDNTAINIISIVDINDMLYLDPSYTPMVLPCANVDHNLINTATMCLDETHIYLTRKLEDASIVVDLISFRDNIVERLPNRPDLDVSTFLFSKYLPLYSEYNALTILFIEDDKLYIYEYNVSTAEWILRFETDEAYVAGLTLEGITLKDLSLFIAKDSTTTRELLYIDTMGAPIVEMTPIELTNYNLQVLDTDGSLYLFNTDNDKTIVIRPITK